MKKAKGIGVYILFCLMALVLGAIAGIIVWGILMLINLLTGVIWEKIPAAIAGGSPGFLYYLVIGVAGAVIIGLLQKRNGILPDEMDEVLAKIKKTGRYSYKNIGAITIAAMMPLIFGAAIGPEAGLTGVIAGLCYWVADSLRARRGRLGEMLDEKSDQGSSLAETGIAVVLSVIFRNPLMGIVGNIEPNGSDEHYKTKFLKKGARIPFYILGVVGALLGVFLIGKLINAEALGLPRFQPDREFGFDQLKWYPLLILIGIGLAMFYLLVKKITEVLSGKIKQYRILSCLIPGICIAFAAFLIPDILFSGESQMGPLSLSWTTSSAGYLITVCLLKILLSNVCISFGWRGGSIFPIIFCGASAGFAFALVTGMDGTLAVAVLCGAMYGYISRKPLLVIAVLCICFPITFIIPVAIGAFIASKIPVPGKKKVQEAAGT
ncbi:MAG: chloride channel protein [Eubacterium sp.]|nr:chloride channel protein [Eubacterium sp.]